MSRTIAWLAAAIALVVVGIALALHPWSWGAAPAGGGLAIGGPFTLVGTDGHAVTDADFRGKWMLIYFGYTRCPDACPMALNNVANALDLIKDKRNRVAPLFITVDPARDTPAVVGHYVSLFDKQIVGLTGSPAQIDAVEREYRVYAARHPLGDSDYSMDHSSILYVMDRQGKFASILDGAASPKDIAAKLGELGN